VGEAKLERKNNNLIVGVVWQFFCLFVVVVQKKM